MDDRRKLPPKDNKTGKNNIRKIPKDYQRRNDTRKVPIKKYVKDEGDASHENSREKENVIEEPRKKEVQRKKIKKEAFGKVGESQKAKYIAKEKISNGNMGRCHTPYSDIFRCFLHY